MILTRKSRLSRFTDDLGGSPHYHCSLPPLCVVGPKFKKPAAPDVTGYTPAPIDKHLDRPRLTLRAERHNILQKAATFPGDWWTLFHSKPLTT